MRAAFTTRRRAEEFNSLVDSTTGLDDTRYAELGDVLELMTALRTAPVPPARPEFVVDLRSRLMLAAESVLVAETKEQSALRTAPVRRTGRERRVAAAVGAFAVLSASGSMAVAAQSSMPGDTLYPLKRAMENLHENALRDADDKGTTMLGNAAGRLAEVDELSRSGSQDGDVISQTLQDFTAQAVQATDLLLDDYAETGQTSTIEDLQTFTTDSLDVLQDLEGLVPVEARGSLIEATRVLDQIGQQVRSACPACGDLIVAATKAPLGAAGDLGPMLTDLLAEPVAEDDGAPRPTPKPSEQPTGKPSEQPDPDGAVAPDPVQTEVEVDPTPDNPDDRTPEPPKLPDTGAGTGGGGGSGGPDLDNPLGDLITGNGGSGEDRDPVGDLLTGTLDATLGAADDLLGGGRSR